MENVNEYRKVLQEVLHRMEDHVLNIILIREFSLLRHVSSQVSRESILGCCGRTTQFGQG